MRRPMQISRAEVHEIPIVLTLVEALFTELGQEGQEFAQIDKDKLFRDIHNDLAQGLAASRFIALLARDKGDVPVGVLTMSSSFAVYAGGEYGIVQEMYVLPAFRGKGIGKALVRAAVIFARDRQWFRLDVTGPEDDPGRTVRFYEALGFEFTGHKLRLLVAG